jgi:hypothetical protein
MSNPKFNKVANTKSTKTSIDQSRLSLMYAIDAACTVAYNEEFERQLDFYNSHLAAVGLKPVGQDDYDAMQEHVESVCQ